MSREQRGLALAETVEISRNGEGWIVPSQTGTGRYNVILNDEKPRCTCRDYEIRHVKCKHIYAVEYTLKQETSPNGSTTVTETVKVTYRQNWPAYNAAQTEEKSRFMLLLSDLCRSIPQPPQTNGRPRLPLSDMAFAGAKGLRGLFL